MQINDKLAPDQLYLQSQNALEVIKIENEKYENLKADFQTNIIDASSLGSTATSLKNYAEDFCLVLDKAIEANEIDKADHEVIQKAIETVYADKVDIHEDLDGFDILGKIEEAKNKIQEIENRIDEINNMSWIEGLYNSWFGSDSIASLESEKSDWEKILEDFQNKEHRYDGIENDTANLLNESEELRELVWTALESIEASFIDGEYVSNPEWKQSFGRIDLKNQNLEVYTYLCSKKNIDGSLKYSEDDIFSIIAYGYKHFETAMKQIEKMKEHSIDSAFNDIVNNIISEWEENSFERRSEKVYAKLTEDQKKCVENLDLLPPEFSEKKACMKYAAIYLFADGYEPEFICGVLGNIYHEGKTGLFEDSHYGRNQNKPLYLVEMDAAVNYTNEYSNKTIMEVGIEKTIELAQIGDFGIGACQWTRDDRTNVLMECYVEVCGDDNYPTEEQAMTAEALCIVRELNDSYYNNLVYQEWIRGNELSTECAAEVVLRKYEAPDGVEGKVNIRVQSSNIIYDYMMGEVK